MLPDNPLRKAIKNPRAIPTFLRYNARNNIKQIVTTAVGTNIFDKDWDICIVLDACRADLADEVFPKSEIDASPGRIWSVAPQSHQWLSRTFTPRHSTIISDRAYITGNTFSNDVDYLQNLAKLDPVWEYAWDQDIGTIPPRPITDQAIRAHRSNKYDRIVVHYMQPHFPALTGGFGSRINPDNSNWESSVWEELEAGNLAREEVWDVYEQNLKEVLQEVRLLLENVEGMVVITADHGNCFGEFGEWGHLRNSINPYVLRVPWYTTQARDQQTHSPKKYDKSHIKSDRESKLRALGYL